MGHAVDPTARGAPSARGNQMPDATCSFRSGDTARRGVAAARRRAAGILALAVVVAQPFAELAPGAASQLPGASAPPALEAAADQTAPLGARSPRNASYTIDVRLDPRARTLTGRQLLTWRNISPLTASELWFHLYYNAWRNTRSTWMRERRLIDGAFGAARRPDEWGWIEVTAVRLLTDGGPVDLTDRTRFAAPDDGNEHDQTVMVLTLPTAVAPGDTAWIEMDWRAHVPRTFSRTGAIGNYFFLAQWFPKIGVLEWTGWNCHQFHASTEFFSDYGVYDVRMTVPTGWVLGATGVQRSVSDNADGSTTHRYYQDDVHDFAWTTSPDYVEHTARFEHPTLPGVALRLLLQPEHVGQAARHLAATRAALSHYGEWFGPYPYDHLTVVDPAWQSGAGGMEYPTLFTAGARWLAPADVSSPEGVTIHEAGHQFWYGLVANNEFEHAWLDEGLNTFASARTLEATGRPSFHATRFFGDFVPWVFRDLAWSRAIDGNRLSRYRAAAELDMQATPSMWYSSGAGEGLSYAKAALWLHTLERHLGWDRLREGLSVFFERAQFEHPGPNDLFDTLSETSGEDLTWFFDQMYRSSNVFDYGVQTLTSRPASETGHLEGSDGLEFVRQTGGEGEFRTTLVVRRYGEAVFPVEILTRFEDGREIRERWDGRDRWTKFTYETPARARDTQIDPERILLLDVDYTNNSRTLDPRSDTAATKWSLKWLVWLQDLLMTYAFFV